ncbi:SDR family NAD(P)-dependent oxidoreductase [Rhizobium skierniewicense]|uniref:SDR family NAD(P)-dependent oxidoreductase n=1 Tax=Rhizobium skierniewicense TaxID=984260 RepID=UPI001922834C
MAQSHSIAVIGMGCRFPGASSLEQFWNNLVDGVESITTFGPIREHETGLEVFAGGILDDVAAFDAALFGLSAREAERMDPQHRVFLECAWEAAERSGYNPRKLPGRTGVFAGTGFNEYLIKNLVPTASDGDLSLLLTNDSSFLPARLAYVLGCTGPTLSVSTACSTSLVAVHLAVQALLADECDTAIAGGVRITTPQKRPYRHEPGGIGSSDGHCRTFDRDASGTVGGNGAGAVVLRRLDDALADGDPIAAVILGSAVNNDGLGRVGFTAPGVDGQRSVIREAQAVAGVSPDTIGMIEAHGTATALGDPVEFEALNAAFGNGTTRRGYCAIGSVKTNIGHLDAAAGIAGLIKTVLSLQNGIIPASLNFSAPNPRIDLETSPFYVNTVARPWPVTTRRAGVSSFGMGGNNAHVVLESAPKQIQTPLENGKLHQIVLSARSEASVRQMAAELADHLELSAPSLVDLAYTLAVSRSSFEWRVSFECTSIAEAIERLRYDLPEIKRGSLVPTAKQHHGRRIALPPTPFEHKRFWVEPHTQLAYEPDPMEWLYAPRLHQSLPVAKRPIEKDRIWLLLTDGFKIAKNVAAALRDAGASVLEVSYGDDISTKALNALFAADAKRPLSILSFWGMANEASSNGHAILLRNYWKPAQLLRNLADRAGDDVHVTFVTTGAFEGLCAPTAPERSMILGLARALPVEYPGWKARVLDVKGSDDGVVEKILAEAHARSNDDEDVVIYRNGYRWTESIQQVKPAKNESVPFREGGVYVVTGGNSGIGLAIGRHLVKRWRARVVALSRGGGVTEPGLTAMSADISDLDDLRRVIHLIRTEHGTINGVIHCAGMPPHSLLRTATDAETIDVFSGKFFGAQNLKTVLYGTKLDFVVLCSSLRGHVPAAGAGDYMAANLAVEALAASWSADGTRVYSIAWDTWLDTGMAITASDERFVPDDMRHGGLSVEDGLNILEAVTTYSLPRVIVSTRPLADLKARAKEAFSVSRAAQDHGLPKRHPRPELTVNYVAPRKDIEVRLVSIWSDILGFEPVGVMDDFYDLGGDSVAILQIVARAREQGIDIDTNKAFEARTIEQLAAAVAGERQEMTIARGVPLPLSPTQQWLFNSGAGDVHRFVQGVVVHLPTQLSVEALSDAINAAIAHHAGLSVHFTETADGWKQVVKSSVFVNVAVHPYAGDGEGQLSEAIEIGRKLQLEMDINHAPLIRAAVVASPAQSFLVLAIHHLVIDAPSWRILLDDIESRVGGAAITGPSAGRTDAPDEAFFRWTKALVDIAATDPLDDDVAFWTSIGTPTGKSLVSSRKGSAFSLQSFLTPAETAVLTSTNRPMEALLAVAVARSIGLSLQADTLQVDVEAFGRGWSRVHENLSRTVGWFTAIHPVLVKTDEDIDVAVADIANLLPEARRRAVAYSVLRQLAPDRLPETSRRDAPVSIAFFPSEDQAPAWPIAAILPAPENFPAPHAIAIAATINDGVLQLDWHGNEEPFEGTLLKMIVSRTMDELRELAALGKKRVNTILAQLDMSEEDHG